MPTQQFIEQMKQKLLDHQKKLLGDLARLNPNEHLGEDLDSNAQEVEDNEVSQDIIARVEADLAKIEKALAKIQNGTYGTDDEGREIPQDRLNVLPWADKSI